MASENVQAYLEKIKKRLELIVIAVLVILIGAVWGLQSVESTLKLPEVKPIPMAKFAPASTANYEAAKKMFTFKSSIEPDDPYARLLKFNIFQVLTAQDRESLEREATAKYSAALKLFNEQRLEEARKICQDILGEVPWHQKTQELLKVINQKSPPQVAPPVAPPRGAPVGGSAPAGAGAPAAGGAPADGGAPMRPAGK
ncbi:MAG: hypothetical protein NTX50_11080 [Candidatus Sumerlaeota bacterium]|nr:hypothetical protein [Candidatus Sumerlaeota bacterium]